MSTYPEEFKALEEENKVLKELLRVAICPNSLSRCKGGKIMNPHGDSTECYWCNMTKQALK